MAEAIVVFIGTSLPHLLKVLQILLVIAAAFGLFHLLLSFIGTGQHVEVVHEFESEHTPLAELADSAQMAERFDCLRSRVDVVRPARKP